MWHELGELLLGLLGALVALSAIYLFLTRAQQDQAADDGAPAAPRHEPLAPDEELAPPPARLAAPGSAPRVDALYICAEAGAPMRRVPAVEAVAGKGLAGDRYFHGKGHWSESDECEVTLIAQEDLDEAMRESGISLRDGRHRRNIVTRDIDLHALIGRRFRVGGALFSAARPRPPCLYLQQLTEPGLAHALVRRSGIGVHCFKGGTIRDGDPIVILDLSLGTLLRRQWRAWRYGEDGTTQPL